MTYTFGTSNDAASRLEEIAKFFNPLAISWIGNHLCRQPDSAVDLGCGPGFTTEMLAGATGAPAVYGLDSSEHFLGLARGRHPGFRFLEHDITRVPFPVRSDVMYSRFVLSHLRDPVAVINTWISQLHSGGLLFVDELEDIDADLEVFNVYLSTNRRLVASKGARLYVGDEISAGEYGGSVLSSELVLLPVQNRQAATWFLPNTVTIWRDNRVVSQCLSDSEMERVSGELAVETRSGSDRSDITWKMRRMVLRKN